MIKKGKKNFLIPPARNRASIPTRGLQSYRGTLALGYGNSLPFNMISQQNIMNEGVELHDEYGNIHDGYFMMFCREFNTIHNPTYLPTYIMNNGWSKTEKKDNRKAWEIWEDDEFMSKHREFMMFRKQPKFVKFTIMNPVMKFSIAGNFGQGHQTYAGPRSEPACSSASLKNSQLRQTFWGSGLLRQHSVKIRWLAGCSRCGFETALADQRERKHESLNLSQKKTETQFEDPAGSNRMRSQNPMERLHARTGLEYATHPVRNSIFGHKRNTVAPPSPHPDVLATVDPLILPAAILPPLNSNGKRVHEENREEVNPRGGRSVVVTAPPVVVPRHCTRTPGIAAASRPNTTSQTTAGKVKSRCLVLRSSDAEI
ncbi:hypothetical protein C8R46DRAFT_1040542 [Mycena filopes]|nr:hypothetical protein C8R46DRAFT_1040542 [Mycena filopes]